jgi:glycosyltransferase 2 family protein
VRSWRVLLGLLISAAFLFYAFRGQDYGAIVDSLKGVNYWLLIPALILYFFGVLARSFRWSVLLRPVKHIHTWDLLPITVIGFMANNVLPLRTGEVVRSYVLSRTQGVRKTAALATIAVERIFDGLTMVGFMLVAALFVDFTSALRHVMTVAVILFVIAIAVLGVMTFAASLRTRFIRFGVQLLPNSFAARIEHMAEAFFSGLAALRSPRAVGLVALSSIVAWSFEASMYLVIARAFGGSIKAVMDVPETLLTTGVANLATLVPSSPGYVGPFEAGIKTVLEGALNASGSQALSYAILVHAALWFPVTVWGAVEWSRLHLSLKQVRAEVESPASLMATSGAHSEAPGLKETVTRTNAA